MKGAWLENDKIKIGAHSFGTIGEFKHLAVIVNNKNDKDIEILKILKQK